MKNKENMDTTSNRGVYNKTRKLHLERTGKIYCARCPYHGIENNTKKWYGSRGIWRCNISTSLTLYKIEDSPRVRHPNWKLVSKNRKQWMKKPVKVKKRNLKYFDDYFELFF